MPRLILRKLGECESLVGWGGRSWDRCRFEFWKRRFRRIGTRFGHFRSPFRTWGRYWWGGCAGSHQLGRARSDVAAGYESFFTAFKMNLREIVGSADQMQGGVFRQSFIRPISLARAIRIKPRRFSAYDIHFLARRLQ